MRLICIAHGGEAQTFLKNLDLVQKEDSFYISSDLALLITGEGLFKAMTILPYIIGKYPITEIINCGIAGALDSSLTLNEIYPIRTCYGYTSSLLYHSYTAKNFPYLKSGSLDCISFENRVLDDRKANDLSHHASVVDRELYAISKIAHKFKLNFSAFKLISDIAGDQTDCFDLKEMAKEFSNSLWEYYEEYYHRTMVTKPTQVINNDIDFPFKTSFTQKKQILKLSQVVHKIKPQNDNAEILENFKTANEYINHLEDIINPINGKIKEKLKLEFAPFHKIGAQIIIDPKLDKKKFVLKMEINSKENLTKLNKALNQFKFQNIENLWEGKTNVQ